MKRRKLKLVIGIGSDQPNDKPIMGWLSRLVDCETGEEIDGLRDLTVHLPLTGPVTVNGIMIYDIEVQRVLPVESAKP